MFNAMTLMIGAIALGKACTRSIRVRGTPLRIAISVAGEASTPRMEVLVIRTMWARTVKTKAVTGKTRTRAMVAISAPGRRFAIAGNHPNVTATIHTSTMPTKKSGTEISVRDSVDIRRSNRPFGFSAQISPKQTASGTAMAAVVPASRAVL